MEGAGGAEIKRGRCGSDMMSAAVQLQLLVRGFLPLFGAGCSSNNTPHHSFHSACLLPAV